MARRDYYNFTHYLLPHTVFNFTEITINQILRNKDKFAEKLKCGWETIEIEEGEERSTAPSFSFEIQEINDNNTLIILKIPEAAKFLEATFVGIVFDENFNVRYFTYELGEDCEVGRYHLCEWTPKWAHLNYGINMEYNTEDFINKVRKAVNL